MNESFPMNTEQATPIRISLDRLSKSFGETEVLQNLNFDEEISSLAIIGPSGGGKSTLLRIMGGLLAPSSGSVTIGTKTLPQTEAALVDYRRRIGFVFQDGGLFHHMTALENVAVPLQVVHGVDEETAHVDARELLTRLGVAAEEGKRPAQLSGGQRQRVAIARALAARPEVLLFDEPTSALDPEYTTEVLDIINDLKRHGTRFVIVTHEMGFARHACDEVAFLYNGTLLEYGPSADVFGNPRTPELQAFLGRLLEWSL